MKTLVRIAGLPVVMSLIFFGTAAANVIPDYTVNDEDSGQEFQHDIACCTHPDGSWTAAWLDYRMGAPGVFTRTFTSDDQPIGPGRALTDGFGLFDFDLNASPISEPTLIPLPDDRSLIVWTEVREGVSRVRASIVDSGDTVFGPVTINDTSRRNGCRHPRAAAAGDRILVVWAESVGPFARVRGQLLGPELGLIGGDFLLHPETATAQNGPVVIEREGGWIAAWEEGEDAPQVTLRAFNHDGAPVSGTRFVDGRPQLAQRDIAILSLPSGYMLGWTSAEQGLVRLLGRAIDSDLDPAGAVFEVYAPEPQTVTPRGPEFVPGAAGSVLIFWPAGPASHTRIFSRAIQPPETPTGEVQILEDPPDPVDGVLIPQSLALSGGDGTPRRVVWWDNREGWDLAYSMRVDEAGLAVDGSLAPIELADGTASQIMPAAAIFPDGTGIAVWEDFRTGGLSIFGRRLDNDGVPQGSSFRVSEMSTGSISAPAMNLRDLLRNRPSIATTTGGSSAAAWTAVFHDGRSRVFLQSYDASGARLGGNFGLPTIVANDPSPNTQSAPTIVGTADGGYVVVWRDTYADSEGDIFARPFLADGTASGDTIRIIDPGPYAGASQDMPAAASSGEGEVVVAWIDGRSGDGDVYVQRIGPTGRRIDRNLLVSGPEGNRPIPQFNPAVGAAPGRYAVVWDDDPLGVGSVTGILTILPSQKIGSASRGIDISFRISTGARGMKYPHLAMNPDGRFVVTYWDTAADSARVMAQRFDPDGGKIGPPYSVAAAGGETLAIPGAVTANGNRIQYAFSDSREMKGWDARVRRVDWTFDGWYSAVMVADWTLGEADGALLLRWSVPLDRAGGRYSVWRDSIEGEDAGAAPGPGAVRLGEAIGPLTSGGADYAFRDASAEPGQRLAYWIEDSDGAFAGPWSGMRGASSAAADIRALGNPFHTSIRLAWTIPRGTPRITIHDAAGRRVRALLPSFDPAAGDPAAPHGETVWDGRDESGRRVPPGVYWARLRALPGIDRSIQILRLR